MHGPLRRAGGAGPWTAIHARMDEHLSGVGAAPLAVAFSGGGDSAALLLAAEAWAKDRGRALIALTVDHGIQAAGAAWARACADICAQRGITHRILAWTGPKPATGLPAAARAARHRLLAEAARQAGAPVILIGHTADDILEAAAMRAAGSTTPSPRPWAPSPVWPEGRGIFLLRPLIGERRAALRETLTALGETWIDDPANDDPRFARARARAAGPHEIALSDAPEVIDPVFADDGLGGLIADREALRGAPAALILKAAVCAGGGERLPRFERAVRIAAMIAGSEAFTATLAGARLIATATKVHVVREAGEAVRGGLADITLAPGMETVWDGRFAMTATRRLRVGAALGRLGQLPNAQRRALKAWPPSARAAAPVIVFEDGTLTCPILAGMPEVQAYGLAYQRLLAATGSNCDVHRALDMAKSLQAS